MRGSGNGNETPSWPSLDGPAKSLTTRSLAKHYRASISQKSFKTFRTTVKKRFEPYEACAKCTRSCHAEGKPPFLLSRNSPADSPTDTPGPAPLSEFDSMRSPRWENVRAPSQWRNPAFWSRRFGQTQQPSHSSVLYARASPLRFCVSIANRRNRGKIKTEPFTSAAERD